MNCNEVAKYLDTYIDGELEAGLMIEVGSHVENCDSCRARELVKRRLKEALLRLSEKRAPESLRRKIEVQMQRRRLTRSAAMFSLVPLAAAATFLFMVVNPVSDVKEEPLAKVVEDVVQHHLKQLPMEVEGRDPLRAASWFRGKVDFPVRAFNLDLKPANFRGARVSHVRAHQAAHMTYNVDGHRVSLMVFNPQSTVLSGGRRVRVGNREILLGRRNGFNVAVFFDGDIAYALSSDLPQSRLLDLVAKIDRRQ